MKGGRKIKTTLYIQQDQRRLAKKMKEISNKRRHRKIIQKMPSFKSSKTEQVLKERAEQQDWTLFKACKICLQQNVLSLTQALSNTFLMVVHIMNQNTPRYLADCYLAYQSKRFSPPVSSRCNYNTQSGLSNSNGGRKNVLFTLSWK